MESGHFLNQIKLQLA